jgi:hypothetical protein
VNCLAAQRLLLLLLQTYTISNHYHQVYYELGLDTVHVLLSQLLLLLLLPGAEWADW